MSIHISIDIPERLQKQIAIFAAADGIDPDEWIRRVLRAQVFKRRFRIAQAEMLRELRQRGIHLTDEEVLGMDRSS